MTAVLDLEPGNLFKIVNVPNGDTEVYEYIGIEERPDRTIQNCHIRSVAFFMDGIWHTRKDQTEHNCNPYAEVQLLRMDFVSKMPAPRNYLDQLQVRFELVNDHGQRVKEHVAWYANMHEVCTAARELPRDFPTTVRMIVDVAFPAK